MDFKKGEPDGSPFLFFGVTAMQSWLSAVET